MTNETPTPPATPTAITRATETQTPNVQTQTVTKTSKPGWQTTEFYAALAVKIPGALMALGFVGPADMATRIIGAAMMVLSMLGYTWARTMVKTMAILAVIFFLPSSCGPSQRQIAIRDSLVTIDTASQAFSSYDALHQQDIVEKATTREQATTNLQDWRDKRTIAIYTISAAYRAISLVATDDNQPLAILANAVRLVQDTLKQLGVKS